MYLYVTRMLLVVPVCRFSHDPKKWQFLCKVLPLPSRASRTPKAPEVQAKPENLLIVIHFNLY